MCDECYQLVYTAGPGTGNHRCPNIILAKSCAELDMAVEAELSTWDYDLKQFWNSRDVQFMQYMLDHNKEI